MSTKAQNISVNSSNGFKKRLLRPVSNKPNEHTALIKNSRILNLRDSLSVKNKYAQVNILVQSLLNEFDERIPNNITEHCDLDQVSTSKGLQHVKEKVLSFKQKKWQISKSTTLTNEISGKKQNHKLTITEKSVNKILSQLQTQNLQDGIRLLYNEQCEINQVIENLCGIISMVNFSGSDKKNYEEFEEFQSINGDQNNLEYFVKMIGIKLKRQIHQNQASSEFPTHQMSQKPKFKPIFTAKDQDSAKEQTQKLKEQISQLNSTIFQLRKSFQSHEYESKVQKDSNISKRLQKVHTEIQSLYDEAIKLRNQEIQKLRNQLIQAHQIIAKQKSINELMNEGDRKNRAKESSAIFCQNSQNLERREFACTVQEQFEKMRGGFMKKMEKIQADFSERQQKMKRQIFSLEKELETKEWEKKLILKKYEFLLEDSQ